MELLGDWSSDGRPLHEQLFDALRTCIERGDLRPGTQLPSERSLANTLAVSRTTVVAAFRRLKSHGYLESARGSGTWVKNVRGFSPTGGVSTPAATVGHNPLFARLGVSSDDTIDFTASIVGPSPAVAETIKQAAWRADAVVTGGGYHPDGLPELRETIAERFTSRGVPTEPDQILVTSGAQQAIMLVAAAFIQPGDPVVTESPTYPGALDAFRLVGANLRTVPVEEDGLSFDEIRQAVEARKPRFVYLIPTFHNPTGTVMAELERRRLARFLEGHSTVVIDDESLVELSLTSEEVPGPLARHHDGVITVGSASKPFWGGLRIGWIRGPEDLIRRFRHYKTVFDLSTPTITQAAAVQLLDRSEEIISERREQLAVQRTVLCDALTALLPDWRWIPPSGGLSVWARIPRGSATELTQVAIRHGLALVPGPFFDPHSQHGMSIRLPFVLSPSLISQGIGRLRQAWDDYSGRADISAEDIA